MSKTKYTKIEKHFAHKRLAHKESLFKKILSKKPIIIAIIIPIFSIISYLGIRFAHVTHIEKIIHETQKDIMNNFSINIEYKNIEYFGWKFWNLKAEIYSPQFIVDHASFKLSGITDRIIIISDIFSNNFNVILPNDLIINLKKIGEKNIKSVLTWDDNYQNMIKFKSVNLIQYIGGSRFIKEIDYSINGLNLIIDNSKYLSINNIEFNTKRNSQINNENSNNILITLNKLSLNKDNKLFKVCSDIFTEKTQDEDFIFDFNCALDIRSKENISNNKTKIADNNADTIFNDKNSKQRTTHNKSNSADQSINITDESKVRYNILNTTTDFFKAKMCAIKSNIFELYFDGDVTMKEDVLQYMNLQNDIVNYEQLIDCYFRIMRDSLNHIGSAGFIDNSDGSVNVDLFKPKKTLDDIKKAEIKTFLKTKLTQDTKKIRLHLILQDPKGRIEIKNGGYFDELLMLFFPDLGV